jgi:hypothetical protein
MIDAKKKESKASKAKPAPQPKKEPRKEFEITPQILKTARESAAVTDYPLAKIRQVLTCPWNIAVKVRHELLKADA